MDVSVLEEEAATEHRLDASAVSARRPDDPARRRRTWGIDPIS